MAKEEIRSGGVFRKAQRREIIKAVGGRCEGCGVKLPARNQENQGKPALEVHHIFPKSWGGVNGEWNAAVLCSPGCHQDANELAFKYNILFSEVKERLGSVPFENFRGRRGQRVERRIERRIERKGIVVRHVLRRLRAS